MQNNHDKETSTDEVQSTREYQKQKLLPMAWLIVHMLVKPNCVWSRNLNNEAAYGPS